MPTSTAPKLSIPTGYEPRQLSIERKRKLAEALMARGLNAPDNMRSWVQALGQLGQTWAGKSMQKAADKEQGVLGEEIRGAYGKSLADFAEKAEKVKTGEISIDDLLRDTAADPFLAEAREPYVAAQRAGLVGDQSVDYKTAYGDDGKARTVGVTNAGNIRPAPAGFNLGNPNMRNINGVAVDLNNKEEGFILPQDPGAKVIRAPDGSWGANPTAIAAEAAAAGFGGTVPVTREPGKAPAEAYSPPTPPLVAGTLSIDKPLGPQFDALTGLTPSSRGAQRSTGVRGTFHATNDARDYYTPTLAENVALGRRLTAQLAPLGIQVIYSENDRSGKHKDNVHLEPGPGLDTQVRKLRSNRSAGIRGPQTATVDGQQYWIINGKVYDNPEGK